MKKIFTMLALVLITVSVFAQATQKMSYQAIIRDAGNNLVTNHIVGMRISILQGSETGTVAYQETYNPNPQTNANGLVTLEIGSGVANTGTFADINWANGPYFIKTETDPVGETDYTITGTSQLLGVPYALFAKTSGDVSGTIAASHISGLQTSITNNPAVLANTAKRSYPHADSIKLSEIKGINTGDQDLSGKVDVIEGKGLSTNDYTVIDKSKVDALTHTIGETYGGGKVFYVYNGGLHGLIAATSDQATGIRWYGGSYTNTRARADGVGGGKANTVIIIAGQGPVDGDSFAATVCNEYSVTMSGVTYGDWYLPSLTELHLLYLQRNVVGGFTSTAYWSSTEANMDSAYGWGFDNGQQFYVGKANVYYVRAIRSF
jgi:hypothetical protein